jgi:hypothetical protein
VYVEHRRWGQAEGTPVALVSKGGESVEIVKDRAAASEVVTVYLDGRQLDRASAISLSNAAVKQQKRQRAGKRDKNVIDQIIADLSAPSPKTKRTRRSGGFAWKGWALAGVVAWIVVCIAAGAPLGIILTPVAGPMMGWICGGFLAIISSFMD